MEDNSKISGDKRRQTKGVNRHLDANYIWPPGFGLTSDVVPDNISKVMSKNPNENSDENAKAESILNGTTHRSDNRASKTRSVRSKALSVDIQIKRLALESEKARQAIEEERLNNRLKMVELEQELREAEILIDEENKTEISSQGNKSVRNLYPEVAIVRPKSQDTISAYTSDRSLVANWIKNIPENLDEIPEDLPNLHTLANTSLRPVDTKVPKASSSTSTLLSNTQPLKSSMSKTYQDNKNDIQTLCEALGNVIKTVAQPSKTTVPSSEKFYARQSVEKDYPFFDGKPEEWCTFIYQFKRISSICGYSEEECIIKLQKCLKGEAKFAVSGMLMSSQNLDLVLKTLEMRFGRPDQIISVVLSKVRSVLPLKDHDMDGLIHLSNHVSCLVATILSLKYEAHLQNPQVLKELCQKLPDNLKLRWGEIIMEKKGNVNLQDFSNWLSQIAAAVCYVTDPKTTSKFNQNSYNSRKFERTLTSLTNHSEIICACCTKKDHKIQNCEKFKSEDIDTRWSVVTKKKLCFSCLRSNHQTQKCKTRQVCGIHNCKLPHHRLLHKENNDERQKPKETASTTLSTSTNNENVMTVGNGQKNVLLRMANVRLYGRNNAVIQTVALFDEASTVTLVDTSILEKLDLVGTIQPLCIQWTNDVIYRHDDSVFLDLDISANLNGARKFKMKNVHSVKDLSLPNQKILAEDWKDYPYLKGLPIQDITDQPMILIGQDNIRLSVPRRVIQGPENLPIASKSNLGWVLHGTTSQIKVKTNTNFHISCHQEHDDNIHQLVKNSFTTESFGSLPISNKINKEEARALYIMKKTAKRVGNRFEIGLLWKTDNLQLPESKTTAYRRLLCVEKQMQKDENFKKKYCENIQQYVEKGYARKLTSEESAEQGPRCWYLPHFGVTNPNKPNKLRLVFDAASKSHGISLNDNLLAGPDLLQSLVVILLKFRQRKIGFSSDIREMFHQVQIRKEDQASQRFLWRDGKTNQNCDVYQMLVMTFGATCSPACAQFVKNLNAEELAPSKRIADAIIKKHYVDDYLDCTDTVQEAQELITEVRKVQKKGGFELVKWTSNSKEVIKLFSADEDMFKDLDLDNTNSILRVLGLSWQTATDNLVFRLKPSLKEENLTKRPTKREILRTVMSVFDPLGLIVNFTIRGRIIVQDIWRSGIGWDDSIDDEIYRTWKSWVTDLQKIDQLNIPRCYSPNIPTAEKLEMHIFCDSSKKAFAAVAYLRILNKDRIETSLIMAKARVAPTKPLSIPRLELQAAVMGSRLKKTLVEELEIKIDATYFWTDSSTVLHWIKNDGTRLGQFESHRVGEIQEITNSCDWYWVPSKLNAADIATRTYNEDGSNTISFQNWFTGPDFLRNPDNSKWPEQKLSLGDSDNKEKVITIKRLSDRNNLTLPDNCLPDINRFSKYNRLIRSTAFQIRFVEIMKSKIRKEETEFPRFLTPEDIKNAEKLWIRKSQEDMFLEDINSLKTNKSLNRQSRLRQLTPTFEENLLVLDGRTNLTPFMTERAKRPYILSPKHKFTVVLIQNYHERYAHQGIELVLNELRQKFWIIDGRAAVKSVFKKCLKCRHRRARQEIPTMGQLPIFRLTPNVRPFTFCGIDYFGPIKVSVGRRQEKRWGVLFTCLSVRAVHLEVAHSLSADSAIMALRRLISRRGRPTQIWSDNGTNFRGAAEELKIAIKNLNKEKIEEFASVTEIQWKFLPPGAPHMGGSWERLVRSVKKTFQIVLNGQVLKDELVLTLFAEVENIINTRPLTHVSVDSQDSEALTPNHFLLGSSNGETTWVKHGEEKHLRRQWEKAQQLANSYWKRWVKEYMPTLTKRSKWTDDAVPIKVNDIVVILDENLPRNTWKKGIVQATIIGPDGRIRVADVRTQNGIFRRPVAKLCRLRLDDGEELEVPHGGENVTASAANT